MSTYKDIPISVAEQFSNDFEKDQVIIVTWDAEHERVHVTTWGRNKADSMKAAEGGNFVKACLGWPDRLCHDVPAWWKAEREALLDACRHALSVLERRAAKLESPGAIKKLKAAIAKAESPNKE